MSGDGSKGSRMMGVIHAPATLRTEVDESGVPRTPTIDPHQSECPTGTASSGLTAVDPRKGTPADRRPFRPKLVRCAEDHQPLQYRRLRIPGGQTAGGVVRASERVAEAMSQVIGGSVSSGASSANRQDAGSYDRAPANRLTYPRCIRVRFPPRACS